MPDTVAYLSDWIGPNSDFNRLQVGPYSFSDTPTRAGV